MDVAQPLLYTHIDVAFYHSFKQLLYGLSAKLILNFIEVGMLLFVLALIIVRNGSVYVGCVYGVGGVGSMLGLVGHVLYVRYLVNGKNCFQMAEITNHIIPPQEPSPPPLMSEWMDASIYSVNHNVRSAEASPELRKAVEKSLYRQLCNLLVQANLAYQALIVWYRRVAFLTIVAVVVLLALGNASEEEVIVYVLYLLAELWMQRRVVGFLLLLGLLPILFLFLLCSWCCQRDSQQKQAQLPHPIVCNIEHINQDCSICFQQLALSQSIIILECSSKHVFHQKCIKTWASVKASCPICRHSLIP